MTNDKNIILDLAEEDNKLVNEKDANKGISKLFSNTENSMC